MKLVALSFHIKDIGVEGLSHLNQRFLPTQGATHIDSHLIHRTLESVRRQAGASELFYLATCNRFEFLLCFEREVPEVFDLGTALIPRAFFGKKSVLDHMLGVALSRDSVVFGENQIMGQLKTAFTQQRETGSVGAQLTRVLSLVLREAKAIRTEMGLSNYHTSIASVAARSVLQFFRSHAESKRRVILVGAGESNQILARYLVKRGITDLYWLNRTQSRAELMASEIGGRALDWDSYYDLVESNLGAPFQNDLPRADVICCATGADALLVNERVLDQVHPGMVVDISMPTNSDRHGIKARGIAYLGLDEINVAMKEERSRFEEILHEMNAHIQESVALMMGELVVHQSSHVLKESVHRSEQLLTEVWEEKLPSELSALSDLQMAALQQWSQKLVKRLTHSHLETLKVVLKKPKE